jgi:hypothetical protein
MTNPTTEMSRPESEAERRVRWSTTATEAYTALHTLYEELRATGHAYAWSAAYEASGQAGVLLTELRALVVPQPPQRPEQTLAELRAHGAQVYALLTGMEETITAEHPPAFGRALPAVSRLAEEAFHLKGLLAMEPAQLATPRPTQEPPCPAE